MKETYGLKNVIFGGIDTNVDNQPMFWSNDNGWVSLPCATLFSDEEKANQQVLPQYNASTTPVWVTLPHPTRMKTLSTFS